MCKSSDFDPGQIAAAYFLNPFAGQAEAGRQALPRPPRPQGTNVIAEDERLRTEAANAAFIKRRQIRANSLLARVGGGAGDLSTPELARAQASAVVGGTIYGKTGLGE
jgi:hypothetical protein